MGENSRSYSRSSSILSGRKNKNEVSFTLSNIQPRPGGYLKIPKGPIDFKAMGKISSIKTLHACTCSDQEICEIFECEALQKLPTKSSSVIDTPESFNFTLQRHQSTTRNFRIRKALEESSTGDQSSFNASRTSPMNVLAIVVSTIMLLSSNNRVADAMLDATVAYLKLLRNNEGRYPPNIQGILNHIMFIKGESPQKTKNSRVGFESGKTDTFPSRCTVLTTSKMKDQRLK